MEQAAHVYGNPDSHLFPEHSIESKSRFYRHLATRSTIPKHAQRAFICLISNNSYVENNWKENVTGACVPLARIIHEARDLPQFMNSSGLVLMGCEGEGSASCGSSVSVYGGSGWACHGGSTYDANERSASSPFWCRSISSRTDSAGERFS